MHKTQTKDDGVNRSELSICQKCFIIVADVSEGETQSAREETILTHIRGATQLGSLNKTT